MARVRWTHDAYMFEARIRGITDTLESGVGDVVEEATREAAEALQEAIETDNQTEWVGKGPYSTQGRQDYGGFRKDVDHKVEHRKKSSKGSYGWIKKREDYYLYQEHGFKHWITNNWIPGVRGLYYAGERAKAKVLEGLSQLFGRL